MSNTSLAKLIVAAMVSSIPFAACASFTFSTIPLIDGTNTSEATGVSKDGLVVVGDCNHSGGNPVIGFRWTKQTGTIELGTAIQNQYAGYPTGVSADGSSISEWVVNGASTPFYWHSGFTAIPKIPMGTDNGQSNGISADGTAVVGFIERPVTDYFGAFRWKAASGTVGLPFLGNDIFSSAIAVSANGVAVGYSGLDFMAHRAVKWDAANAGHILPVHGSDVFSEALAINKDGTVIGGTTGANGSANGACIWTAAGVKYLGEPSGDGSAQVTAISDDGKVIGVTTRFSGYIWTAQSGFVKLGDYLTSHGVNLGGYYPVTVAGMTSDGKTVVGKASGPHYSAYLATLDIPPTPNKLTFSSPSVAGGNKDYGNVYLSGMSLTDTVINFSSANIGIATVPASVTILAGKISAAFTVLSKPVAVLKHLQIKATLNEATIANTLIVTPPALTSVKLTAATVKGGLNDTGRAYLDVNAPAAGITVNLSSDSAAATVPATALVSSGNNFTSQFIIHTSAVMASTTVHISASYNGVTQKVTLTINP